MAAQANPRPARGRGLKYWQKTYVATLALFLACLLGTIAGVLTFGRGQNFSAAVSEALARQQYLVAGLGQDAATLAASRPGALPKLCEYYGERFLREGVALEVREGDAALFSSLPAFTAESRPELEVQAGQRIYLVRPTSAGRMLFISARLPEPLEATMVTCAFNIQVFFDEWGRLRFLCLSIGGGVSALFALALYAVLARMYRPLGQVTATARAIAGGDLTVRAPAARTDEMGELGRSLNEMAGQVQAKLSELQAAADEKQRLIDNLSHEMRTPLTAIGGWAETIQRAELDRDELLEATDTILFESRRVLALSRQLLKLSVLHHEPLETEPVELEALFARVRRAVAPKAAQRGVVFALAGVAAPGTVQADPVLLESLLINLADNGVKACAPGGRVELSALRAKGRVLLAVTDTGRGMSAETLAHLGQPFYRADKARSRAEGGAGLGLALCFEIARRHGAELKFESIPGRGTRASLVFTT